MFLAGPALVKAAIGQEVDAETLGGATTHSSISGIVDYKEKDDYLGLKRIKKIISNINFTNQLIFKKSEFFLEPKYESQDMLGVINPQNPDQYDMNEIISRIVDGSDLDEYKSEYGKTIICGNAKIGGYKVGIIANQRKIIKTD